MAKSYSLQLAPLIIVEGFHSFALLIADRQSEFDASIENLAFFRA